MIAAVSSPCEPGSPSEMLVVQVVRSLAASVGIMQAALPVLQALHNPVIKDRHWTKLAAIMGTPLITDPPLTLSQLLELKVHHELCQLTSGTLSADKYDSQICC